MERNVAKYQTQQVMTASPAKLVYMLYERAIVSLREAIAAIEKGDIEARWKANKRATDIVDHLWSAIDTEQGGEIAENLDKLLGALLLRLPDVDMNNDAKTAEEIIRVLEPLRDAWREISKNGVGTNAGTGPQYPGNTPASPSGERTIVSA